MPDDINQEYEELFGKAVKVDLFDADEDYYNNFRQEIIDTPRAFNLFHQLPFTGVKITPYIEYRLMEEVKKAESKGYHVFFINHSKPEENDFCYAAGYYLPNNKLFTILKYSRIALRSAFKVRDNYLARKRKNALLNKTAFDNGQYFLSRDLTCYDPRIGACFVMGERVDMDVWRDSRDRPPSAYYRHVDLTPLDDPFAPPPKPQKNNSAPPQNTPKHHLFYIKVNEHVNALGYFEPGTKYFYICKGSTIEQFLRGVPDSSDYATNRQRLIDSCAEKKLFSWQLIKDAKCRSAEVAATYVTGRVAGYEEWKDEKGLRLWDVFPEYFDKKEPEQPRKFKFFNFLRSKKPQVHLFHIVRTNDPMHSCNATGHYDPIAKSFVLHKDSILALEVNPSIKHSAGDLLRRVFIQKNCTKQTDGYRLREDRSCISPEQAALYVIGYKADGWSIWKDDEGKSLEEVYNK